MADPNFNPNILLLEQLLDPQAPLPSSRRGMAAGCLCFLLQLRLVMFPQQSSPVLGWGMPAAPPSPAPASSPPGKGQRCRPLCGPAMGSAV